MRYNPIFKQYLDCSNSEDVFGYLTHNFVDSISAYDYFVNWAKVFSNVSELEIDLNTMNYLVGKENIEEEFKKLIKQQPQLIRILPILIGSREQFFKILELSSLFNSTSGLNLIYKSYNFKPRMNISDKEIEDICEFAKKTCILDLFENKKIKSVPDYVIGVEVGLDSNGRKNRSGTAMEKIIEITLSKICTANNFQYMKQATSGMIKHKWGLKVSVDKSNRAFDFAVKNDDTLYLVETNYYGGGGSKLKATAGEYKSLYNFIKPQGHKFIWITEGLGWNTAIKPLEEAFNETDYIFNLKMISTGLLADIIKQKL